MVDDNTSQESVLIHQARARVAQKVRELRQQKGWSQRQLAERAGIDRTHLARFETQAVNISLDVLFRLAAALHIAPCELLPDCGCSKLESISCNDTTNPTEDSKTE